MSDFGLSPDKTSSSFHNSEMMGTRIVWVSTIISVEDSGAGSVSTIIWIEDSGGGFSITVSSTASLSFIFSVILRIFLPLIIVSGGFAKILEKVSPLEEDGGFLGLSARSCLSFLWTLKTSIAVALNRFLINFKFLFEKKLLPSLCLIMSVKIQITDDKIGEVMDTFGCPPKIAFMKLVEDPDTENSLTVRGKKLSSPYKRAKNLSRWNNVTVRDRSGHV